jgi:hypothetical protein
VLGGNSAESLREVSVYASVLPRSSHYWYFLVSGSFLPYGYSPVPVATTRYMARVLDLARSSTVPVRYWYLAS